MHYVEKKSDTLAIIDNVEAASTFFTNIRSFLNIHSMTKDIFHQLIKICEKDDSLKSIKNSCSVSNSISKIKYKKGTHDSFN